jgi:hypothetical protein
VSSEQSPPRGAATGDPSLAHHGKHPSSVKSGCFAIKVSNQLACFSNGEVLPPRGMAVALPSPRFDNQTEIPDL